MEVEEFLETVHLNCVDNVLSMHNDDFFSNNIGVGNLVAVTGNELMEVEDFIGDRHPVVDSEKNVTLSVDDEICFTKTEAATDNELIKIEDFLNDAPLIVDSKEKIINPVDDMHTKKIGNEESIPCTNNVLMEVDFLDDLNPVQDNEQNDICPPKDGISSECEDLDANVEKAILKQNAERSIEELNRQSEEIVSSPATEPIDRRINQLENGDDLSKTVDGPLVKCETSGLSHNTCTSSNPDFSKLKGKICLDTLSVRELQETFRAAFGRETSIKDKEWLKRRISMGLSNSCHILSMTFIIDEGNKVKIVQDKSTGVIGDTFTEDLLVGGIGGCCEDSPLGINNQSKGPGNASGERLTKPSAGHNPQGSGGGTKRVRKPTKRYIKDSEVGEMNENCRRYQICGDNRSEDPKNVSRERSTNPGGGHDYSSDDLQNSGVGSKRARKPTKRYIEELSVIESKENNGNLMSISKVSGHKGASSKPCVSPKRDVRSMRRPLATRRDSLGGLGVEVPYVCRIRRSRPRENYEALMKLHPGSMDVTEKPVKGELGSCDPLDNGRGDKVLAAESYSSRDQKPVMDELEKEMHYEERETFEPEKDNENIKPRKENSPRDNSDNDTPYVEAAKGVIRKHHRPWSLTEVVDLVEGVAKFGVGRWSEIKKLSFADNPYRTSVDLKDKWRNLLKASFAPTAEKGNLRKQISAPIPPHIRVRVRELVKLHSQVPPVFNSNKSNREDHARVTSVGFL